METAGGTLSYPDQQRPTETPFRGTSILWFLFDTLGIYAIARLGAPWLVRYMRYIMLLLLGHDSASSGMQLLFSHLLALTFLPGFLIGLINGKFRSKLAIFVWIVPAAVLAYKLLTFSSSISVLEHGQFFAGLQHFFGGNVALPESHTSQSFLLSASYKDVQKALDQFQFTGPFYVGVGYSIGIWISLRTQLITRAQRAFGNWDEQRFGSRQTDQPVD